MPPLGRHFCLWQKAIAVLYDGERLIKTVELSVGTQTVTFDSLEANKIYQYAIVAIYDKLDGNGKQHYVLTNCDELVALAGSVASRIDGGMREGLVLRSEQNPTFSFKAVDPSFLVKYHG